MVLCFLSIQANAQNLPCESLLIEAVNDTFLIETDRKKILVRTDKGEERMVQDVACLNISRPGFYQIFAGIENSIGQLNESFYLTIRHEDGRVNGAKNPNAGPYRVVKDFDTVKGAPGTKIDTTRDAGLFYLPHGLNTIVLNHYYLIQNEYPDFLNPPNQKINTANIESVHLFKMGFIFIEDSLHDLRLSKSASADTVEPGEQFSYTLKIENLGPNTSRNITLTDTIPEFLVIDESSFSVAPNSLSENTDHTLLVWNLGSLDADLTADISYFVSVEDSDVLPESPFEVVNTSSVFAEGDTNLFNNFASSTVVVDISHDLRLSKKASVDTVQPGMQFSYTLKIENLGPNNSRNITLTDTIPEFLVIDESSFSVAPNSLSENTDHTLLVWNLGSLDADLTADISYFVSVEDSDVLPESPFEVVNTSSVFAEGDTNLFNNFASSTVVVKKPILLTDISVLQFVKTDSFSVQGADTLWFVKPGDTFSYFIKVTNQSDVEAVNVILKDVLPDSVRVGNFASGDTIDWQLGNLQPLRDTTLTFEATLSTNVGEELIELKNTVLVQADNEDPQKLADNISIATETVFVILPEMISESCELLTLDFNVYEPQSGAPLGITFELNASRKVQLDVYDMGGSHVMKLVENTFKEGANRFEWFGLTENGRKVGSGVYIITLLSDNLICWKKVIIAR